jgi:ribosomal-protein-alanine N-acetyltransferase
LIETPRLQLRPWKAEDLDPFAALCADEAVMEHFPSTLTRDQSAESIEGFQRRMNDDGFAPWALECRRTGHFVGFVGLMRVRFQAHFTPAVEIGWRLAREAWGQGYASEGAKAVLQQAFETLGLSELVSVTAVANRRSRAVMERIGMKRSPGDDFPHPGLPEGEPTRPHVLYRLQALEWRTRAPTSKD